MKILVVSNFYPPHTIGGYELGCRDVVEGLRQRGHDLQVLTSTHGLLHPERIDQVERVLAVDLGWDWAKTGTGWRLFQKELANRRAMRRALVTFKPDLVYIWSLRYCSVALAMQAQRAPVPTCFYVSDTWLTEWQGRDRWFQTPHDSWRRRLKQALNGAVEWVGGRTNGELRLQHLQCTSDYIRRVTAPAGEARVIHWGIDPAKVVTRAPRVNGPLRLLYAGQLIAHKGVHTALRACELLCADGVDVTLTLAGAAADVNYLRELTALAAPLGERVRFTGGLPRAELATLYAAHDVLLFPSIWPEPFSIGLLEGMAAGLGVVATATGGTAEILRDQHNALLFTPDNEAECATAITRLHHEPDLLAKLGNAARATVLESFRLDQMLDQVEQHVQQVYYESRQQPD